MDSNFPALIDAEIIRTDPGPAPKNFEETRFLSRRTELYGSSFVRCAHSVGQLFAEVHGEEVRMNRVLARCVGAAGELSTAEELELEDEDPTQNWRERLALEGIVGRSRALAAVFEAVAAAAPFDMAVLLTGPSGCGKSMLARAIHENSNRKKGPFVALNCGALDEHLIISELFGTEIGGHSTATRRNEGKVAAAEHGTLFLDEIAELPLSAQAMLLELTQSKTYYRLASNQPTQANIRLIAATNADLEERVRMRQFREDLLFRLDVIRIAVPSLSERREDLLPLAEAACTKVSHRLGLPLLPLSGEARAAVRGAEWAGGIRELENKMQRAVVFAHGHRATQIEAPHIFPQYRRTVQIRDRSNLTLQEAKQQFQKDFIERALEESAWNVAAASRRLGVTRSYVHKMIKVYGIRRPRGALSSIADTESSSNLG